MADSGILSGILGQDTAVAALRAQFARTRGAGSTLISGPEGTGRFLLALGAAQQILGSNAATSARVVSQQHADLAVLETAEGIDGVRDAIENLSRRPAEAARKVLIVRDADQLSLEAQNAMLKTLEEPPADAAVFVVAEHPQFLPETVVSRCRLVRARPLALPPMRTLLPRLGVPVEFAADAEGSPGRALFHHREGSGEGATALLRLLGAKGADPIGETEALAKRAPGEEAKAHRRRMAEVLRIAACRLRQKLPGTEAALRSVLDALRSVDANVSAPLIFADLALLPWTPPPRTPQPN